MKVGDTVYVKEGWGIPFGGMPAKIVGKQPDGLVGVEVVVVLGPWRSNPIPATYLPERLGPLDKAEYDKMLEGTSHEIGTV